MKIPMFVCAGAFFIMQSCNFGREIQVMKVNMQLVKIDTIYRESGDMKVFTWLSEDRMKYQSLEPLGTPGPDVGATIAMLIKR